MPSILAAVEWFWQQPSWHWSYIWALVALALPSLVIWVYRFSPSRVAPGNPRPIVDFVNGKDGKWSTSKTSILLWTVAVWFVFLAILVHTRGEGIQGAVLKDEYFVVLGIPAAAALAAKGITANKVEAGEIDKPVEAGHADPVQGIGELFSDDTGRTDLLDSQYFGFNLILLGFFFLQFFAKPNGGLPDLPDTLLALSGVSAATYVGKKGFSDDTGPTIRSIVPPSAAPGEQIRILASNVATARERTVFVTIGDVEASDFQVLVKPVVTEIRATVPAGVPPGETKVVVIGHDGRATAGHDFEIK